MFRRVPLVMFVALSLVGAAACGTAESPAASSPTVAPAAPAGPLLLAQFARGVGAISPSSVDPVWTDADAVAAPDGSAVFSMRRDGESRLVRLDPRTGDVTTSWPAETGLSVSAVSPSGHWIALTEPRDAVTELVVFDAARGVEAHRRALVGHLRPEAFSVSGEYVFALADRGDSYRVQTIDLATGERWDTSDRDKALPPEDMYGTSVHGVLSTDGTLLATLYRNPHDAEEPAFVHVLDLEHSWSYCADLAAPFGTGPPGSDVIELTPRGTIVVAATEATRLAEIHIAEVHQPSTSPVTVEYRAGTATTDESGFRAIPGFMHGIAALPL